MNCFLLCPREEAAAAGSGAVSAAVKAGLQCCGGGRRGALRERCSLVWSALGSCSSLLLQCGGLPLPHRLS